MPDVVTDPSLSVAYRALERRREEVIAARDRIAAELKKLDAALEALQTLAENVPEAAKADGREAAPPAAEATEAPAKVAPKPAARKSAGARKPAAVRKPAGVRKPAAAPEPAASESAASESAASESAASEQAAVAGRAADRKARVIEVLLENPRQWFTSSEVALLTEGENISETQRNAVSETMRRLLRGGAVQRDGENRPIKYRAVSAALRELLLSRQ
jgi:hypothetical protein